MLRGGCKGTRAETPSRKVDSAESGDRIFITDSDSRPGFQEEERKRKGGWREKKLKEKKGQKKKDKGKKYHVVVKYHARGFSRNSSCNIAASNEKSEVR